MFARGKDGLPGGKRLGGLLAAGIAPSATPYLHYLIPMEGQKTGKSNGQECDLISFGILNLRDTRQLGVNIGVRYVNRRYSTGIENSRVRNFHCNLKVRYRYQHLALAQDDAPHASPESLVLGN